MLQTHIEVGVGALQHAVARYFGADYLCQAVWHKTVDKAVDGLVYTVEPTIHSHESVFNIGTKHHALSPKLVEPCLKEFGLDGSHTAHHSIARPGLEHLCERLGTFYATAPLYLGPRHGRQLAQCVEVLGGGGFGTIEVDHMNAVQPMRHILAYHVDGAGVILFFLRIIALRQTHTAAVYQVYCGKYGHKLIKFLSMRSPTSPLFSGWNCVA